MGKIYTPKELLSVLIGFDTTSFRSNREMIDFIVDYLSSHGISSSLGFNEEETKADLVATIGPQVAGGIILSGHTDVVPVAGQDWNTDPFVAQEKGDKIFGRGSCDMKGFIAVVLAMIPEILKFNLKVPLHLAFSYDEEVGCLGAPALISRILKDIAPPSAAIIGEPTGMKLVNAHKGGTMFETTITGCAGHASQTQNGVNAISLAGLCISFLDKKAEEFKIKGPRDDRMEPPYNTISIGTIEGGTAHNIIAGSCKLVWGCRSIAKEDAISLMDEFINYCNREIIPPFKKISTDTEILTTEINGIPPLMARESNPAEELVLQLTGKNEILGVAFGTEAGLFDDAGIPSVVFGPGHIDQAHKPDEFVAISQLEECSLFIQKMAKWSAEQ